MSLLVVGLSHRSAPVDVLERVAASSADVDKVLHQLLEGEHVAEALLPVPVDDTYRPYVVVGPVVDGAIAGSFRTTGAQPDGDSIRFRFGVGGQAFTLSTLRRQQTVVAPALLDVVVIDHPDSPGSATRRAGSSAEDTVRGMMGGG